MDVGPISPTPPEGLPSALPRVIGPQFAAAIPAILDIAAIGQLSPQDTDRLSGVLAPAASPQTPAQIQELVSSAISLAQKGDVDGAVRQLTEVARLDPGQADVLRTQPGLESIRPQVEQVLVRLKTVAGLEAQSRLAEAAKAIEGGNVQAVPGWEARPEVVLATANRLYEAGTYIGYVYGAALAQVVVESARVRPATVSGQRAVVLRVSQKLKMLWGRAPLLVLMISWFVLGLAAMGVVAALHQVWPEEYSRGLVDTGFGLWGIGLVGFVLYGLYRSVQWPGR